MCRDHDNSRIEITPSLHDQFYPYYSTFSYHFYSSSGFLQSQKVNLISVITERMSTNYLNIIDLATIPLVMSYLFIPDINQNHYQVKLLYLFVLFLLFFRSITHLSIFPPFTSIIKIVSMIIIKMIPFLIMVFVFYVSVVFMVIYIRNEDNNEDGENDKLSISDCFIRVYYWVIFGGLGEGDFKLDLSMVPLIIGPIFIGVILMNIMIGFLSNEYSRLEEIQKIKNLIYKAEMNLDIEILFYLVRSLLKIKVNRVFF
jgi:hypothetical protein